MDIVSGLIQKLESVSALTALLAFHANDPTKHAIYPNVIPQESKKPLIKLRQIDGEGTRSLAGETGLADARIEVEVQTESAQGYGQLQAIKKQLYLSCTVSDGATWGTVEVQSCALEDSIDEDFGAPEKGNNFIQGGGFMFQIWYNRTPVLA